MAMHPAQPSVVRWPSGLGTSGKAIGWTRAVRWPAAPGSVPITHPGYSVVVPPDAGEWDRELLPITDLGSAIATGISLRAKPVVVQMLDMVFWCNGIDAPQIYDPSSGNVYDLGITAPAAAPGTADTGTGSFTGTYNYSVRWYRSSTGEYSAPSAIKTHTCSGSDSTVTVTWTDPSLSGVDKAQIYRSKNGGIGLYLLAEVDITAETWNDVGTADDTIDISLQPPSRPAPGASSTVPTFRWMMPYLGRMWAIAGDNTLYWSPPNAPWLFSSLSSRKIAPQDRDICTGFGVAGGVLFIGKARHMYMLANIESLQTASGEPIFLPDIRLVDDSTGFASQHAVVGVENTLIFMSGEGKIYQLPAGRGLVAQERAPLLERTLKRLFTNRLSEIEIGYAEHERKVLVSCTVDEAAHNNLTLAMDMTTQGWIPYDINAEALTEFRDSDGRGRLVFGNVRGDLAQVGVGHGHGARYGTLAGTVTAATKNTLTDSTASFDAGVPGLPVHLFDSKWNLVQENMIGVRDSATALTMVWKWKTIPDPTAETFNYVVGGILPYWRFGWMDLPDEWMGVKEITIRYVPSRGKVGVYHAINDEADVLVGTVNLSGEGIERIQVMASCYRFRTSLRGYDGASKLSLTSIEWEVE